VTIDRHKYIVFKREELMEAVKDMSEYFIEEKLDALALDDAVVVRKRDYFASSALYAYASAVGTLADIAEQHDTISSAEIERLRNLSEFFAGEAMHAVNMKHRQVPT
jgi:hypothetical protein